MRAAGNQSVSTKHKKYFSPYLFYMVKLKLTFILSAGEIFSQLIVLAEGADLGFAKPLQFVALYTIMKIPQDRSHLEVKLRYSKINSISLI